MADPSTLAPGVTMIFVQAEDEFSRQVRQAIIAIADSVNRFFLIFIILY